MAKPKAPPWLAEAFRDGVDERDGGEDWRGVERARGRAAYPGAHPNCWLAHHDPARRPCAGDPSHFLERFHFIPRQRVEAAIWEALRGAIVDEPCPTCHGLGTVIDPTQLAPTPGYHRQRVACWDCDRVGTFRAPLVKAEVDDLILLAAWDPRNGGLACEQHHRRFDDHQVSLPRDRVIVPYSALPPHVVHFAFDYGIDAQLGRFPASI